MAASRAVVADAMLKEQTTMLFFFLHDHDSRAIRMRIRVTLQENPCETIAFHVRTPGGNVHSCRKLFSMLNIERRWHSKSDRKVEELSYANGQE